MSKEALDLEKRRDLLVPGILRPVIQSQSSSGVLRKAAEPAKNGPAYII
jgi:hypothetical protein